VLTCVGASAVVASVADAADVVARVVDAVSDAAAPSGAAGSLDADVAEPYAAVPPSFADVGAAGPSDYAPSFADAVAAQGAAAGDAVFAGHSNADVLLHVPDERRQEQVASPEELAPH
jgi:hypothetical protein